jgi:hypothetical protein
MSPEDPQVQSRLTPLEEAALRSENPNEAGVLVEDIDEFVAETDPEHLSEAEAELAAWQPPQDPLRRPVNVPRGNDSTVVAVFSAYSEAEANIVKGVLDAAGIPSSFDSYGGSVMGGIFTAGEQLWADIVVPEAYADQARQAIVDASVETADIGVSSTGTLESQSGTAGPTVEMPET